jgi:asparagine synthase (glutamine-hydrolysing)
MCGILGVYRPTGPLPEAADFKSALERLRRRGPDDDGIWNDHHVRLGHKRLAVIDLSAAGHQPMLSADGRYVIVFNGEIYNHQDLRARLQPVGGWRGTSDTETLLEAFRAWGTGCLDHLSGMFAFAIWDRLGRSLFLARDRMGVKPLYYSWHGGQFAFASRPGALTVLAGANGSDVDPEALRVYLELGYIPAPLSFYRNIRKLRPGHYMSIDQKGLADEKCPRIVRYWDYRHIAPDASLRRRPESELVEELDELIRRVVRERLISDVPLGAFLSGGTDSALVVAAMKAAGVANPNTFTISFKEAAYDEGPAAARIAKHIGVDHITEVLSVDNLLSLMPLFIEEFDEPLADSSAFPTLAVARLARRHVTVALTGDGSDELFGGYHYYSLAERLTPIIGWPPGVKRRVRRALTRMPSHKAKMLAGALAPDTPVGLFQYLRSYGKDFAPLLDDDILRSTGTAESWFAQSAACFAVDLTSAEIGMRLDAGFLLPDAYLQKVDVATMAFSLEARCPLTDYRLVEWAMRLPVEHKLRGRHTKYLLKQVLCRYLPRELVHRPKMGFGVPVAQWLRGPLKEWAWNLINDDAVMSRVPLVKSRVLDLFRSHVSGARDAHPLLWAVLMLLCFVAHHDCRHGIPEIAQPRAA